MLNKLNIKKDYYLVAVAILLLVTTYQLDFKKTIEAWHLHQGLKQQVQQAGSLSYQPGYLQRKNGNLDNILKKYRTDTINLRSNTLSIISAIAEQQRAKLSDIPISDNHSDDYKGNVMKLGFEGDYFSLIKTLGSLESKDGIGIVRSVEFTKPLSNINDNGKSPKMIIFLQSANN